MSGAGLGTMLVSLLGNHINVNFGYTGYFAALSFITSLNIILVLFGFPLEEENENCSEKRLHFEKLLKNKKGDMKAWTCKKKIDFRVIQMSLRVTLASLRTRFSPFIDKYSHILLHTV